LWITEGQKKGDALASLGLCVIALLGVWNWRGKNELCGSTVLADWEHIALRGRDVRIVFDSDLRSNPHVQAALKRLTGWLGSKGAYVRAVYLPALPGLEKTGVDDWLAAGHGREELEALIEMPRPEPQPNPAVAELLDEAPLLMTRPLMLLNGRGLRRPGVVKRRHRDSNKKKS
jgi:hypothetical protein